MRNLENLHLSAAQLRKKLIPLLRDEPYVAICDSCGMKSAAGVNHFELIIAWGKQTTLEARISDAFEMVEELHREHQDWIFGVFSYDLKNSLEELESNGFHPTEMPPAAFFIPEHIVTLNRSGEMKWMSHSWKVTDLLTFLDKNPLTGLPVFSETTEFVHSVNQTEYLQKVAFIQDQIREGNVYELNYCHEFHAFPAHLNDPLGLYEKIRDESATPFSSYFRFKDYFKMGCSPERFMNRTGRNLISQPIKGTAPRKVNPEEDVNEKNQLSHSEKEKAENVMIVDLVRNDFARSCETGSVFVKELFEVYSFPKVHQMISTIEGKEREDLPLLYSLKNAFPMGSMTGAPKIAAMKLIDQLEHQRRGWYSGTFGYITPTGDYDFNVIIRSYIYNRKSDYLSLMAGGAITIDSLPESEYEESLLKARFLLNAIL